MKSEWKECTIGDIGTIVTGKTPSTRHAEWWGGAVPFVTPKDIQGTKHCLATERYVTEAGVGVVASAKLPPHAVCVSCIGNIGYVAMTTKECISNQQVNSIIVNEKYDCDFVYYLMKSLWPFFKNYEGQSTALSILNKTAFSRLSVSTPPLPTQRKIAAVLSSLDDKIETNNAICRNLEEMSRCVLSEWLTAEARNVEYIPLSELADINAKTYSEKEKWPFVYYLDTGSITNGRVDSLAYIDVNKEKLPSRARRKISMGDIVYSTVRPTQRHFGIIYDVQPNMLVSTGFAVICSNCTDVCNELIYIMLTEPTFVESMQQIGEQSVSTYPSVNPADIATCSIPVSKEVSYQKIQDVIQSNFKKIGDLQKENCRLAALRDTLLPRLMSGELGVSAVKL